MEPEFKKGKYNARGEELFKRKMCSEVSFKAKTTFLTNDGATTVCDILQNGGQSEIQKRGTLQGGGEYIVLKIYFIDNEQ